MQIMDRYGQGLLAVPGTALFMEPFEATISVFRPYSLQYVSKLMHVT